MEWANKLGISNERVFAALGVKGIEEVGVDQLVLLSGLRTAIKDGDSTVEEAFPPLTDQPIVLVISSPET